MWLCIGTLLTGPPHPRTAEGPPKTPPLCGGWTRRQSTHGYGRPNGVTTTGGRPPRPQSRHSPHLSLTHSLISPFGATYLPTWSHSSTIHGPSCGSSHSSASSSSVPLPFHLKKECPFWLSVSLLLHPISLLIQAGIEPHPGPVQDLYLLCGSRGHAGWVAFLCMVCDQWCHRRCAGIHSTADYQRLATWSCPTCSTPVPPAAPTREAESLDMEQMLHVQVPFHRTQLTCSDEHYRTSTCL